MPVFQSFLLWHCVTPDCYLRHLQQQMHLREFPGSTHRDSVWVELSARLSGALVTQMSVGPSHLRNVLRPSSSAWPLCSSAPWRGVLHTLGLSLTLVLTQPLLCAGGHAPSAAYVLQTPAKPQTPTGHITKNRTGSGIFYAMSKKVEMWSWSFCVRPRWHVKYMFYTDSRARPESITQDRTFKNERGKR